MTRAAKLFTLENKDYKELTEILDNHKKHSLKHLVSIYQIHQDGEKENYGVLSVSDETDKIIEDYGAKQADKRDLIKITLIDGNKQLLYGNKDVLSFLDRG